METSEKQTTAKEMSPELESFRERLLAEYSFETQASLSEYQDSSEAFFVNPKTSPSYNGGHQEESRDHPAHISMKQSNQLFKELLVAEGFSQTLATQLFKDEIQPFNNEIVQVTKEIETKKNAQHKKPKGFDALAGFNSSTDDAQEELDALYRKQKSLFASRLVAMRQIILHPEKYELEKDQLAIDRETAIRTTDEFTHLLKQGAFDECFYVNRVEISATNKEKMCRDLLQVTLPTENVDAQTKKAIETAKDLLLNKCIRPSIDSIEKIRKNSSISPVAKHKALLKKNNKLARMVADMVDNGIESIQKYGVLIMDGIDQGVVNMNPRLTLRLPEGVYLKMEEIKRNEELSDDVKRRKRSALIYSFYRDLVNNRYEDEKVTSLLHNYSTYDEAGAKPNQLIGIEVNFLLKQVGFSNKVIQRIGEEVLSPYFAEKKRLNEQFASKQEMSATEKRGLIRQVRKNRMQFEDRITNHLENYNFYQMMYEGLNKAGKLLTKAEEDNQKEKTYLEILQNLSPDDRQSWTDKIQKTYREEWQQELEQVFDSTLDVLRKDDKELDSLLKAFENGWEEIQEILGEEDVDRQRFGEVFTEIDSIQIQLTKIVK